MPAPLTIDQANAVYNILVEHAGASEDGREDFVFVETDQHCQEYRFVGALGFGGKFRLGGFGGRWYVDCYPEDMTTERGQMIGAANQALAELRATVSS